MKQKMQKFPVAVVTFAFCNVAWNGYSRPSDLAG
jgi:hypothetical protein